MNDTHPEARPPAPKREDAIVEEVRKARREIADFYGNDLMAIAIAASRGFPDFPPCLDAGDGEGTLPAFACEEAGQYDATAGK